MKYETNYRKAVNWLNNDLILCNDIVDIDPSVYDNMRFPIEDEEGNWMDIYQWYLTDCSEGDVEFLERHFELHFTYSDVLDKFVLCVPHYGTAWDYVYWTTDLEQAKARLGQW